MNCKKAEQWLSLELDGELPESRQSLLRAHVEECPACRELERQWRSCGNLVREAQPVPEQTPEAAWADVRRSIRMQGVRKEEEARPFVPVFGWRLQGAGVMLLLVVLGMGVWLINRTGKGPALVSAPEHSPDTVVEWVETSLPDAAPMVYEDADSGMMVIWVMVNGEKEKQDVGS